MIEVGNMIVKVLNGYDILCLHLTEVLFLSEVGSTLVLIVCFDELGLLMTFAEGFCTIKELNEEMIRWIPCTFKGLYCVVHEYETANATMKMEW